DNSKRLFPELSVKGAGGQLYHWILPSFFQLLKDLVQEGREFAIIFRSFGSNLPRVLSSVSRALNEGAHPLLDMKEILQMYKVPSDLIRCSRRGIVVSRAKESISTRDGERGLYQYFSSVQGLGGFQDYYDWWASKTFSIRGGKPLWVDPFDQHVQHIFINDHIRQDDEHTIVHPKVFLDPGGTETRTACTSKLYDITLVQTDLLWAISHPSYFTQTPLNCMSVSVTTSSLGFH
uniref:Si:dkey-32e6.3 n=1 Tax=Sander lucioperca TaxID=283035 RepID=A0A8C9ZR02_SANLU